MNKSIYDFNQKAADYDQYYATPYGRHIDQAEKRLVGRQINRFSGTKTLEIGAGTGHWSAFFASHNLQITGIDVAHQMLAKAQERNIPQAEFLLHDASETWPFANESFDNIVAITSLEFIRNRKAALKEAYRVLKPNGFFLAGVLNLNSPLGQNKTANEVFSAANFYTHETLAEELSLFGIAHIDGAGIIDAQMNVLDANNDHPNKEQRIKNGVFLCGLVQKK